VALNNGYAYREQIQKGAAAQTLLAYLARTWTHSTRDEWADRIRRGEVDLDGVVARGDAVLHAGQHLTWHRSAWEEPDVPLHFDVLHEDEAVVAVAKPSGLPTMPAGGFFANTLATLVRARYPNAVPVHRLGRHTSGVVVFARTAEAASVLSAAWREHSVHKRYRALGSGVALLDEYVIDVPIGPVAHPLLGSVHAASPTGKISHSLARVVGRRTSSTLFQVDITTGRPHQIRIHLACVGHALVGDPLYGAGGLPCANCKALPGDGGYLLHAELVRFTHPRSAVPSEICATPPAVLAPMTTAEV